PKLLVRPQRHVLLIVGDALNVGKMMIAPELGVAGAANEFQQFSLLSANEVEAVEFADAHERVAGQAGVGDSASDRAAGNALKQLAHGGRTSERRVGHSFDLTDSTRWDRAIFHVILSRPGRQCGSSVFASRCPAP